MYTGIRPKQNNKVNIINHNLPDQLTEDARKFKGIVYSGITNLPYNRITNLQGILPCRLIQIQTISSSFPPANNVFFSMSRIS